MLSDLWDKHLKGIVEQVGQLVMSLVNGALEIYNKFINPIVKFLYTLLKPAFQFIGTYIADIIGNLFSTISTVVSNILKVFQGIVDFIVGVFTGDWKKAWEGVKTAFSGVIDGLIGIFKMPLNFIIGGINSFIGGLNAIKIPDWVPVVGGKFMNIPKIPKLARGGIVDKPTTALIGEAGTEAVVPLENNTGWLDKIAGMITDKLGGNGGGQPINITVKVGEDTIFKKFYDYQEARQFLTNGEVVL